VRGGCEIERILKVWPGSFFGGQLMRRASPSWLLCFLLTFSFFVIPAFGSQEKSVTEQVQVSPPPFPRAYPPATNATAKELEERGDELRSEKATIDAIDYYRAALAKEPDNAQLYNKIGICELSTQHYGEAGQYFRRAIHADKRYADAYNNLGVIDYLTKKYSKAIKQYQKALELQDDIASYYSNLGAAYFSKKEYEKANDNYLRALQLDPDIFDRTSRNGVTAQMSSPEDRARYEYEMAKLYAKLGNSERSLKYLRRSMEDGYKGINEVYKDLAFTELRKDPRFTQLMAAKPPGIPE
jgi:tetratricopeptide (TPR) repeat protein